MDLSQHGHMGMAQFPVGGKSGMGIQNILYFMSNIIFICSNKENNQPTLEHRRFKPSNNIHPGHAQNAEVYDQIS